MRIERNLKRVVLLAGPSLPPEIPADVEVREPARRGDFLKFANEPESLLVFADGCFFSDGAPTHYELLHYLGRQQFLIGTASMGALRAAELSRYGLRGTGTAFHAVVSGVICDDAELAVAMCPFTYAALTVPTINLRRLLHLFRECGVSNNILFRAWNVARSIYFLDRTLLNIVRAWKSERLGELCDAALVAEKHNEVLFDVKKQDVLLALSHAKNVLISGSDSVNILPPRLDLYEAQ